MNKRCMSVKTWRSGCAFFLLLLLSGPLANVCAWEVFFGACRFSDDSGLGTVARAGSCPATTGALNLQDKGIKELPATVFADMPAMTYVFLLAFGNYNMTCTHTHTHTHTHVHAVSTLVCHHPHHHAVLLWWRCAALCVCVSSLTVCIQRVEATDVSPFTQLS